MFLKKIIITVVLALGFNVQAANDTGLFIEPSLSYEVSKAKLMYPAPFNNSSGSINGFGLGARLGFHVHESIFIAADGRYTFGKLKDSDNNFNADTQIFTLAPVIGFQMPDIGLRVWGGYVLASEADPDKDNNLDLKFKNGKGLKLGAGFRVKSFSINVEFQDLTYNKTKVESLGPFATNISSDDIELNNQSYILSVSFPYEM